LEPNFVSIPKPGRERNFGKTEYSIKKIVNWKAGSYVLDPTDLEKLKSPFSIFIGITTLLFTTISKVFPFSCICFYFLKHPVVSLSLHSISVFHPCFKNIRIFLFGLVHGIRFIVSILDFAIHFGVTNTFYFLYRASQILLLLYVQNLNVRTFIIYPAKGNLSSSNCKENQQRDIQP